MKFKKRTITPVVTDYHSGDIFVRVRRNWHTGRTSLSLYCDGTVITNTHIGKFNSNLKEAFDDIRFDLKTISEQWNCKTIKEMAQYIKDSEW